MYIKNIVGKGRNQEEFLFFSTIFCNLILNFCVKTRTRFSLRDKRLFEIIEVELTRVDCISGGQSSLPLSSLSDKILTENYLTE